MKRRIASAIALSFALSSVAIMPAAAEQEAQSTQFRSVERQSFSQNELQRFGLSANDAAQIGAYQDAGYQVQVVSPEEAQQMTGGQFSNTQWLIIGLIVVIVVVAAS